jgi:hypothetical protein
MKGKKAEISGYTIKWIVYITIILVVSAALYFIFNSMKG